MRFRLVIALIALFFVGCGGREKVGREPTVYNDDSVYGTASGSNSEMEEVDIQETQPDYRPPGESVGFEDLDIAAEGVDQLPDWGPVYFDFDKANLTAEARETLTNYGSQLKEHPDWRILIEGHCDSRGTEEYNQALGERRAESVRRFLVGLGVYESQMETISYGELKPSVFTEDEGSWAQNRRAEFRIQK